jgi:hypothetical protein
MLRYSVSDLLPLFQYPNHKFLPNELTETVTLVLYSGGAGFESKQTHRVS